MAFLVYEPPQKTDFGFKKGFYDRHILPQVQPFFLKIHIRYLYALHSFSKRGPVTPQTSRLGTKIVTRHCGKGHILSFALWQEDGEAFSTLGNGVIWKTLSALTTIVPFGSSRKRILTTT